jgi:hypothetical protein
MLPPHRLYDYKIVLEAKNNLGYSPLYKIIAKELKITKQYLVNNLNKGFIAPSQLLFAALILFIKKANCNSFNEGYA